MEPLWVIDFPMFERNEDENRWQALHHPFTSPADGHEDLLETDPGKALSKAFDMILNGSEIGGGSVRIHRRDIQLKVFHALNIGALMKPRRNLAFYWKPYSMEHHLMVELHSALTVSSP